MNNELWYQRTNRCTSFFIIFCLRCRFETEKRHRFFSSCPQTRVYPLSATCQRAYYYYWGGLPLCIRWRREAVEAELNMPRGAGVKPVSRFQGANKHIQGADTAVTSPLVPLSPLRAAGKGATSSPPPWCHGKKNKTTTKKHLLVPVRGQKYMTGLTRRRV